MKHEGSSWSFEDSSLGRSFLWGLAITALPAVSGFVVSWVIARWAGPGVMGTVSWVMSYATAVLIVGKFGLDLAASRLASEYGVTSPASLRPLFVKAVGLRALFTLPVALLTLIFAPRIAGFFPDPDLTNPIRVGALIVVCASIYEFNENFLIGLNRLATVYKIRAVHLLARVAATSLLVSLGFGAVAVLGGYSGAWLLAIVVYAILLHRYLPASDASSDRVDAGRLLRLSTALAVSSASVTIYSHIDRLMLGYFSGMEELGQYAVARNITEVSVFPVFAMVMTLRPALAARFSTGRVSECADIIQHSIRFCFVIGVLFSGIFVALGADLVRFVYSDAFLPAGRLMVFFVGVAVARSLGAVLLPALIAANMARVYAYLTAGSAVLHFSLNLFLIPRYQSRGAIIATIISYSLLLIVGLGVMLAKYRIPIRLAAVSVGARTILAGTIATGVIWRLADRPGPLSWVALLWAVLLLGLYLVLIYVLRVATFSNVSKLFSNLSKQKR
jgi:O-antigen/teichoic acid export membrane protein